MVDTPVHEAQQDEQRGASIRTRMGQYAALCIGWAWTTRTTSRTRASRGAGRGVRAGGQRPRPRP
eukprot:4348241-Prymnesium_polylepis.1